MKNDKIDTGVRLKELKKIIVAVLKRNDVACGIVSEIFGRLIYGKNLEEVNR